MVFSSNHVSDEEPFTFTQWRLQTINYVTIIEYSECIYYLLYWINHVYDRYTDAEATNTRT